MSETDDERPLTPSENRQVRNVLRFFQVGEKPTLPEEVRSIKRWQVATSSGVGAILLIVVTALINLLFDGRVKILPPREPAAVLTTQEVVSQNSEPDGLLASKQEREWYEE